MPKPRPFISSTLAPSLVTLALAAAVLLLHALRPAWATPTIRSYFDGALAAAIGILIVRILGYLTFDAYFVQRKGRPAPELLRVVLAVVGYAIVFVLVYTLVLHRSLGGFLATSAVLSIVLGLALQDTLGNFFAGLSLHVEQPFHIGDSLRVGEYIGQVESVTWRTTAIRTNDNSLVVFPNSQVAKDPIEVFRLQGLNRRVLRFPAPYAVPPRKVIELVQEAMQSIAGVARARQPVVRVHEFSDSSITYELLYYVRDYRSTPHLDATIREHVWYLFGRHGIGIPFPIRHLLMERIAAPAPAARMDRVSVVERVDVLEPLDRASKQAVADAAVSRVYGPGEVVLRQDAPGDSMFVVVRGRAEVRLAGPGQEARRVAVHEAGDYFGEMGLFTGETRSADVVALEELELLEIGKQTLLPLLQASPALAERFSLVVAERQQHLAQVGRTLSKASPTEPGTILTRIRRYFGLV